MIPIEFSYNGRKYKSMTDTFGPALEAAIRNVISSKLNALETEILAQGGTFEIKMIDSVDYKIQVLGVTEELRERVELALLLN